jgi:hypothetical protein
MISAVYGGIGLGCVVWVEVLLLLNFPCNGQSYTDFGLIDKIF